MGPRASKTRTVNINLADPTGAVGGGTSGAVGWEEVGGGGAADRVVG